MRAGYGYETALDMSPRQLVAIYGLHAETVKNDIFSAAVGARVSGASKRQWQKFVKELTDE